MLQEPTEEGGGWGSILCDLVSAQGALCIVLTVLKTF